MSSRHSLKGPQGTFISHDFVIPTCEACGRRTRAWSTDDLCSYCRKRGIELYPIGAKRDVVIYLSRADGLWHGYSKTAMTESSSDLQSLLGRFAPHSRLPGSWRDHITLSEALKSA